LLSFHRSQSPNAFIRGLADTFRLLERPQLQLPKSSFIGLRGKVFCQLPTEQVCVQLPTPAVDVALPALSAARRAAAASCRGAGRAARDRYFPPPDPSAVARSLLQPPLSGTLYPTTFNLHHLFLPFAGS